MAKDETSVIASYLSRVVTAEHAPAKKNRVDCRIGGGNYTIVAEEDEAYIRRVAAYVDEQIAGIISGGHISREDAAVLAACNIADEKLKASETEESLRRQMKGYLDDIARLRTEVGALRRELNKQAKAEKE